MEAFSVENFEYVFLLLPTFFGAVVIATYGTIFSQSVIAYLYERSLRQQHSVTVETPDEEHV